MKLGQGRLWVAVRVITRQAWHGKFHVGAQTLQPIRTRLAGRSGHNATNFARQVLCWRANLTAGRSGHNAPSLARQVLCWRANITAGRSGHNATNLARQVCRLLRRLLLWLINSRHHRGHFGF